MDVFKNKSISILFSLIMLSSCAAQKEAFKGDLAEKMICDSEQPLSLGEIHLKINEWEDPAANTCIYINKDGSFGWEWSRASGGQEDRDYPNYPEAEFGINPWNNYGTDISTTQLLPLQLKDFKSASMTVDVVTDIKGENRGWNLAFEMWVSDTNPTLGHAKPKGEIMVFLSNAPQYDPATPETTKIIDDGFNKYRLYQTSDSWGEWGRYRQYRLDTSHGKFNGTLNIQAFIDYFINVEGWGKNLWVTRFELGNEVYKNTSGKAHIKHLSFEINGQIKKASPK